MTLDETKSAAAVMTASETKNIQQRYRHGKSDDGWVDCPDPDWDWDSFEYRVAQEPTDVEADVSRQLEREAAAWKAVAEKLATEMRDLAWLSGPAGSTQPNDAELALAAFDALKSQLEKP
jgi:hypothetical protein